MLTSHSLTSLSLGTFYAVASYQNNIPMMIAFMPGRLLAAIVFRRSGGEWASVAPFEGMMGIITAIGSGLKCVNNILLNCNMYM